MLKHITSSPVIIIIGKTLASLEDSARFHPVFTSLDFATIFFFYRARLSALCPTLNLEDQVSVFMSPSNKVAQLYPQAPGSLFVAFYVSQGYGGDILTHLRTGTLSVVP
jgi:hypothetical protein